MLRNHESCSPGVRRHQSSSRRAEASQAPIAASPLLAPPGPTPSRVAAGLSSRLIYRRARTDQARRGAWAQGGRSQAAEAGTRRTWVTPRSGPVASRQSIWHFSQEVGVRGQRHGSSQCRPRPPDPGPGSGVQGPGSRGRGMAHAPKLRGARDRPMPRGTRSNHRAAPPCSGTFRVARRPRAK